MNILFVCTGNVCRSFTAEKLLKNLHDKSSKYFLSVKSCGIAAEQYFQVPNQVKDFLKGEGINNTDHKPSYASENLIDWADLILVMESWQYDIISDKFPQSMRKMYLFIEYCLDEKDKNKAQLTDPMGKSDKYFAATLQKIKDCAEKLFDKLKTA